MKGRAFAFTLARWAALACRRHGARVVATVVVLAPGLAGAETFTITAINATQPINGNARFSMVVDISKFMFFGIGTGVSTYPTPSSTVDQLNFDPLTASIPAAAGPSTTPVDGQNAGVSWDGTAPQFTFPARSLPVRVHSNGGQVSISASVAIPLATTTGEIASFSQLTVTSDNGDVLPPLSPNPGTSQGQTGPPMLVTLPPNGVTDFSGTWTFTFSPDADLLPGAYNGRLRYTATSL